VDNVKKSQLKSGRGKILQRPSPQNINIMTENTKLPEDEVCMSIEYILDTWRRMANWLQFGLISFGFLAIACSVCIATFNVEIGHLATKILAACATLFLTLISSFSLASKASNVRDGWRHLNKAMYNYKTKSIDITALIKAYEEGEKILGTVEFNYDKSQFTKLKPLVTNGDDAIQDNKSKDTTGPDQGAESKDKKNKAADNKPSEANEDNKNDMTQKGKDTAEGDKKTEETS